MDMSEDRSHKLYEISEKHYEMLKDTRDFDRERSLVDIGVISIDEDEKYKDSLNDIYESEKNLKMLDDLYQKEDEYDQIRDEDTDSKTR